MNIVADEQIKVVVQIVIKPATTRTPLSFTSGDTSLKRHICKFPATFIHKQMIRADATYEHIDVTIIVEVTAAHSVAIHWNVEPGTSRHIREFACSIVRVESRRWQRCGLLFSPRPDVGIDAQQILVAVVVEVQKRTTTTHCFRQQLFAFCSVFMDEVDTGNFCNISERNFGNGHRRSRSGDRKSGGTACRSNFLLLWTHQPPNGDTYDGQQDNRCDRPTQRSADDFVILDLFRFRRLGF